MILIADSSALIALAVIDKLKASQIYIDDKTFALVLKMAGEV